MNDELLQAIINAIMSASPTENDYRTADACEEIVKIWKKQKKERSKK